MKCEQIREILETLAPVAMPVNGIIRDFRSADGRKR